MDEERVEAVLLWSDDGPSDAVTQWLRTRGLEVLPMSAGLLVCGTRTRFEAAFDTTIGPRERATTLPVPAELQHHVQSIGLPALRKFVKGG
jgi:hypothetical protein